MRPPCETAQLIKFPKSVFHTSPEKTSPTEATTNDPATEWEEATEKEENSKRNPQRCSDACSIIQVELQIPVKKGRGKVFYSLNGRKPAQTYYP